MASNSDKLPIAFQLDGQLIDGAIVNQLFFSAFIDCINETSSMKEPKTFEAKLKRQRMVKQVTYFTNGSAAKVSINDIGRMPIAAARAITARLEDIDDKGGKIVKPGDGVDTSIVFELSTPIPVGQGKPSIKELEFLAKTYGEVEDVLAASGSIHQAYMLIQTVAKPLGTSLSLLPSWAVERVTISDGMAIARLVVPHFFGQVPE